MRIPIRRRTSRPKTDPARTRTTARTLDPGFDAAEGETQDGLEAAIAEALDGVSPGEHSMYEPFIDEVLDELESEFFSDYDDFDRGCRQTRYTKPFRLGKGWHVTSREPREPASRALQKYSLW